jgi:hypothetical protein
LTLTRIFASLALFAILLMATALILGLFVGDIHGTQDLQRLGWARVHRLLGLASAVVVVLVDSIVVTYFIGTSRWCKEVSEAYELGNDFVGRSGTLKRRTFPWALLSMLAVVAVGALGAAADPATLRPGSENWVIVHLTGALAGFAFIALAFFIQGQRIAANHEVIEAVMAQVRRIRREHGLEV